MFVTDEWRSISLAAAVTEQVLADLYAGLETSPVLSGFHEHAQLQCPDLECLARHGIATLEPGDLLAILVAGGALAASWHIAQIEPSLLFGAQDGDISGPFSRVSFHRSCPRHFATPHCADDRNHQISIMGTTLAIMLGFPLALLATDRLCFTGVVYEMDGDSSAGAVEPP